MAAAARQGPPEVTSWRPRIHQLAFGVLMRCTHAEGHVIFLCMVMLWSAPRVGGVPFEVPSFLPVTQSVLSERFAAFLRGGVVTQSVLSVRFAAFFCAAGS